MYRKIIQVFVICNAVESFSFGLRAFGSRFEKHSKLTPKPGSQGASCLTAETARHEYCSKLRQTLSKMMMSLDDTVR